MNRRVAHLALVFGLAGAVSALSVGCGSDDDSTSTPKGGAGGLAGSAGKSGSTGKGGSSGSSGKSGTGNEVGGSAGTIGSPAGSAGVEEGGAKGMAGDHGDTAGTGPGGAGGEGGIGEGGAGNGQGGYTQAQIDRGTVIVRSTALCGGCHTAAASGSLELGGNALFAGGTLPAPNLTNDPNGIGNWTDAKVINAFRNGVDDEGRQLSSAMPYWLFHNMSDDDAKSVVAFLRSLPHSSVEIATATTVATAVTPLSPSSLPDTTLASSIQTTRQQCRVSTCSAASPSA